MMTTTVNGTVAEAKPISQQQRDNATYWQDLQSQFGSTHWLELDMGFLHYCLFAMGIGNDEQGRNNYSVARSCLHTGQIAVNPSRAKHIKSPYPVAGAKQRGE